MSTVKFVYTGSSAGPVRQAFVTRQDGSPDYTVNYPSGYDGGNEGTPASSASYRGGYPRRTDDIPAWPGDDAEGVKHDFHSFGFHC